MLGIPVALHCDAVIDACLLYTSDAADERSSVDLGGRRIIKKKNSQAISGIHRIDKEEIYKRITQ